jgi:hypothetical protein
MRTLHILLPGCLLLSAFSYQQGAAQDLNKEITIDRDIVPAQRAAARPVVFPSLTAPSVSSVNLQMEEAGNPAKLTTALTPYAPASTPEAFAETLYRGYLDLGYFPMANLNVSAGYAIVDKEATKLNVWLQANNRSYKSREGSIWDDNKWKTFDLNFGVNFAQRFGRYNVLRLATDLAYSNWNMANACLVKGEEKYSDLVEDTFENFHNFRWHLNGAFDGRINESLTYGFGAGVGVFKNKKHTEMWIGGGSEVTYPLEDNQFSVNFKAYLREQVNDNTSAGIKVEGNFLNYSSFLTPELYVEAKASSTHLDELSGKTLGQVDFTPYLDYNAGSFYGKVGARIGLSINSGKKLHVAPDVVLGVNPDARFGAWLKFGGGVQPNSLERMYAVSRYADTRMAYYFSNLALDGQLGLRVGPFYGASLTLTADYAAANDWLMPCQVVRYNSVCNTFLPSKVRGWKVGAKIDWQYRSLIALSASYERNLGSDDDRAWIDWYDFARDVIGASVSVTPISPLTIDLGITARLNRRQYVAEVAFVDYLNEQDYVTTSHYEESTSKLGDLTDLWAGASWRFTPAFTVFARFENILNKRAALVFNIPNQGFTGLFGIGYKF